MTDEQSICFIGVDAGTTNTRVWLLRDAEIVAKAQASVGVRDSAREGAPDRLHEALRKLLAQMQGEAQARKLQPACVVAAGMITSPLGLTEVPHVAAPAGLAELSAATKEHYFLHITGLPVLLVPGVCSGAASCALAEIGATDVMRGEETLCLGLLARGQLRANACLLNLGSHWKLIRLDEQARIARSTSSLAGEMIHTAQTQTILAEALPPDRPATLDHAWLAAGMEEQRRAGLPRALFCVRLLQQRASGTAEERMAFLVGAFLAADFDGLRARGELQGSSPIAIAGADASADAWQAALSQAGFSARRLSEAEVESAMLAGLRAIALACLFNYS